MKGRDRYPSTGPSYGDTFYRWCVEYEDENGGSGSVSYAAFYNLSQADKNLAANFDSDREQGRGYPKITDTYLVKYIPMVTASIVEFKS